MVPMLTLSEFTTLTLCVSVFFSAYDNIFKLVRSTLLISQDSLSFGCQSSELQEVLPNKVSGIIVSFLLMFVLAGNSSLSYIHIYYRL